MYICIFNANITTPVAAACFLFDYLLHLHFVAFIFLLYLCVCCICICIFSDTVTSGCCLFCIYIFAAFAFVFASIFLLYLCVCCICICIFSDTVTSGCCQHLACLSPLTSPSWQPMHIPTCYWWIIFAYLPTTIWVAIQPNTDFKSFFVCGWTLNSFVWRGEFLGWSKINPSGADVQMDLWVAQ